MTVPPEENQEGRRETAGPEAGREAEMGCPLCQLYNALLRLAGPQSEFCRHLQKARVEVYKAVRSLIDQRLEVLEKTAQTGTKKGFQKIKVEED
ncbi:MAG: hypothetical protein JRI57_09455 [Deltaproteobacteria bacterium]|nr:hypothetical protein [Deltaproteobacteria bacterium]MBW1952273.1 hypothetical protein [Deltaproteobacteria bacterium]MBW1987061.1 hypothetical protein [Deltaproteobacteria bacterium]MBW2133980.1 hypothetical protein [Deltaproteobacteria bacterium]